MSYSKARPQQQKQVVKLHCKVCESAKKPMSMITSHLPKNREGVTVCPTLLSQECKQCGKKGHTVKYCTIGEPRYSAKLSPSDPFQESKYNENKKANKRSAKILLASFNVLYESDEDEDEEEPVVVKKLEEPRIQKSLRPQTQVPLKVKAKFDWATAESDSEGDESESDM